MADMKQIFTYPLNSGTDWIDPDYIGNANSGLTRRVDELLDETYKSWTNLDPVSDLGTTASEAMQNMSKYIKYYGDNQWIQNLTFNDFWYQPLIVLNKVLIAQPATIQLGDTNNPATITTTANHEFEDGMVVRLSNLDGSWATVIGTNTDYYVKKIDADELQISKNSALTDLIGFISTQTIDVTSDLQGDGLDIVQLVFPTSYDYPDGMAVDVNSVQFNGQNLVGNTYYVKESTAGAPTYDLYEDSGLTNPLKVHEILPFTQEQFTGTVNVDNAIATIDTSGDPITSNETKGFVGAELYFAGSGDDFPNSTTNMIHLKSTSTSQLWEMYDDENFQYPLDGDVTRDREWNVIGHTLGNHLYDDTYNIQFYNINQWKKNDTDALVAQPPVVAGTNYNLAQLEGTTLWAGPSISSDNYANLYTDAALTQPLTRDSLDGDLFTYANNGLSSFPLKTDTLTLTEDGTVPNSPVLAQQTCVWWSKTGIQDYVASGTQLYQDPATHIIYTDFAKTQPVEAQAFTTPDDANGLGVDWMPNGSDTDTAILKIPNRTQTIERIQIEATQSSNTLNALAGQDLYLTHLGNQEYEMYTNSAKTSAVTANTYRSYLASGGGPILDNNFGSSYPGQNFVTSTTQLNKNQLAFWLPDDVYAAGTNQNVVMFPGNRWYYLVEDLSYNNPWIYRVFNDAARQQPFNSPIEFNDQINIANIMDAGFATQGFSLPYNGEQLFTSTESGIDHLEYDVQTVTGNGQNLSNTQFYPDATYTNQGYGIFEDTNLTNPLTVGQINNNSAGLTKTYQLTPSRKLMGQMAGGTFRDNGMQYENSGGATDYQNFNRVVSVDGDNDTGSMNSKLRQLGSRKFIHSDTDIIDTDNKLLTQAGLLTDGNEYYIDFCYTQYVPTAITINGNTQPFPYTDNKAWGLFTSFNNSYAQPVIPIQYNAKDFSSGTETPFTTVDMFPDDLMLADASLDYQMYSNFPLDENGDNILTTHGTVQDDGQTVTLNDPVNHASTFGWFTITSHNSFADTIATNETLRLSPTEKVKYTGYTLNGDRLFELVDNNDTKIPVNLGNYPSTSVTVQNTDFLPADENFAPSAPWDYVTTGHYSFHAIADSVTLDRRKPYVFWDASNNIYVGMWTGQTYEKPNTNPTQVYKNMMFWTKTGWANSERHIVDTAVPTTLYTNWFALAPTSTRTSSATFDYEDAFAFNNIAGEYSTTQTTPNGIPLTKNNGWIVSQDYSVQGTEPTTEPGQPGIGNPGGHIGAAFMNAENTGYDQWHLTYDIVVPALQRHTLGTATSMLYVEEVVWGSPTARTDGRQQVVAYNPTYNNTDTTANPYYNYFNHGDIIDLPGIDGTGTAPYILLRRGDNTKLKYKYTTTSTPNPTGNDIVTEDMEGEVWGVIPLTDWTGFADQGYNAGTWTNNQYWINDMPNLYTIQNSGNSNALNFLQQGPISTLPMFSKFQPTHTYPNTYAISTGAAYTGNVTVRAGNVATGTPLSSSAFDFIAGKQQEQAPLNHTNKYKVTEETPWELGTVPINTVPISERKVAGYANIGCNSPKSVRATMKRYITTTETHDLFGYEGRISFDSPCKLQSTSLDIKPAYTGDVNITFGLTHTNTTQGTIALSPNQPQPYRGDSVDIILPGNATYSYQDTNNVTQYGASIESNKWYEPGTNEITANTPNETDATFTVGLNGSGKLNSIALATNGRFDNGNQQARNLQAFANQYNPPAPTPAELADVWDTDDEWTSNAYNGAKEWPNHVRPRSATINYSAPTIVNNSQSGVKYTRSVGHTKWRLEVEYPPMSVEDFQKFHAIAQAAHGQSTPFYFVLQGENQNLLWRNMDGGPNTTTSPLLKTPIVAGDTTMLVEGFASNETDAFIQGEVFIDGENENGNLHTSLSGTDSNIFGEAKIRTPWPFRRNAHAGSKVYKDPYHAVVTLADDNFEYSVDTNGYYFVSVAFDLDGWK